MSACLTMLFNIVTDLEGWCRLQFCARCGARTLVLLGHWRKHQFQYQAQAHVLHSSREAWTTLAKVRMNLLLNHQLTFQLRIPLGNRYCTGPADLDSTRGRRGKAKVERCRRRREDDEKTTRRRRKIDEKTTRKRRENETTSYTDETPTRHR